MPRTIGKHLRTERIGPKIEKNQKISKNIENLGLGALETILGFGGSEVASGHISSSPVAKSSIHGEFITESVF